MGNLFNQKLASLWASALWSTQGAVTNAMADLDTGAATTSTSACINGTVTTAAACILTVAVPSSYGSGVQRAGQVCYVALSTGVVSGGTLVTTVKQAGWKAITAGSTPADGTLSYTNVSAMRQPFGGGSVKLRWNGYCWMIERIGGLVGASPATA